MKIDGKNDFSTIKKWPVLLCRWPYKSHTLLYSEQYHLSRKRKVVSWHLGLMASHVPSSLVLWKIVQDLQKLEKGNLFLLFPLMALENRNGTSTSEALHKLPDPPGSIRIVRLVSTSFCCFFILIITSHLMSVHCFLKVSEEEINNYSFHVYIYRITLPSNTRKR